MQTWDGENLFIDISNHRISAAVVDHVKTLILDGRLQPGDRLPSERKLCELMGVARVTVREAMRVLEAGGLVEIGVGRRGGAVVTKPSSARLATGLAKLISLAPPTASEVTEARLIFETRIMPTLVDRVTDEDIADLRAMTNEHIRAVRNGTYTTAMSAGFHNRIGAGTHNVAIEMLMRSFHGSLLKPLRGATTAGPPMGQPGAFEHRDIVEAVAARDVLTATAIMQRHIGRTAHRLSRADNEESPAST